jgi:hypothetical protein
MLLDCRVLLAGDLGVAVLEEHNKSHFLNAHNYARVKKGLNTVNWNDYLAKNANRWSRNLARTCQKLSSGTNFGENIAIEWGSFPTNPHIIVRKWLYMKKTEIIWPETRYIGCAKAFCIDNHSEARATIYVCHYFPKERSDDEIVFIPRLNF